MAAASKKSGNFKASPKNISSSYRIRTIKPPARPGTVKRSVIRKAVKELKAEHANI